MNLWKKWYQTTKSSICQNQKLKSWWSQSWPLKSRQKNCIKDQTHKCNICHIVHPAFANKLRTNYAFNAKFGNNLKSRIRLLVIRRFWRILNTLLEVVLTFTTSSGCHPLKIDWSHWLCAFQASKCSFRASSSKKPFSLGD